MRMGPRHPWLGAAAFRLALPLLAAGQAQKELVHNEALLRLDLVSQPVVPLLIRATIPNPKEISSIAFASTRVRFARSRRLPGS